MTEIVNRSLTVLDFGGHPQKRNYMGYGAVNPKTDVTAEQVNALATLAERVNRMTPAASVIGKTFSTTVMKVARCETAWGSFGEYGVGTAPVEAPVLENVSLVGNVRTVRVTFPSTVHDWDGSIKTFTLSQAVASSNSDGAVTVTTVGNVVTLSYLEFDEITWVLQAW